ncbi:MAG: UvrB/UvrC motif-containing protein [Synergistaceae bacterium]|jgi:protein arginine kinase activator|nr:UvrB/UvrC motif-containing protein [Synergistaceae bacterium]
MLCNNCGKREVEVLIKQVVNQEVHLLHLCRQCAEELGFISQDMPSVAILFSQNGADMQKQKKVKRVQPKKKEQFFDFMVCPSCGIKFGEFREIGLLGCPKCYESFRFPLGAYLQRIQGAESHWDMISELFEEQNPESAASIAEELGRLKDEQERSISNLKLEMRDAISQENYERAAELRDMLASLHGDSEKK